MRTQLNIKGSIALATKKSLRARQQRMATVVTKFWKDAVMRSELSTRAKKRYSEAITPYKTKPGAYISDHVAKLLESGWDKFDMKPGLLKGVMSRVVPLGGGVFRTVSQNSPVDSWIHPGFKGAKVVEKVQRSLAKLIGEATSG